MESAKLKVKKSHKINKTFNQHFPGEIKIQLTFFIQTSIALYLEQIANEMYPIPDYSQCCPLCNGVDCAVFYRVYDRKMVIIKLTNYYDFPIICMKCHGKGEIQSKHKSFSLLPHMLLPYRKTDINTMVETLKYQQTGKTKVQTIAHISRMGAETDLPLDNNQINDFNKIFTAAFDKLNSVPQLKEQMHQTAGFDSSNPVGAVICFTESYQSELLVIARMNSSNIVKLSYAFFYYFQTEIYFDRHFLFGTPSQNR